MLKKTLLSLAIAVSTAGLTACNLSSTADSDAVASDPILAGQAGQVPSTVTPLFNPARAQLPLATDFLFGFPKNADGSPVYPEDADGTLYNAGAYTTNSDGDRVLIGVGEEGYNPVINALNEMDGVSIIAEIDIPLSGDIDAASINPTENVILLPLNYDDPITGDLVAGESPFDTEFTDFTVSRIKYATPEGEASKYALRVNLTKPLASKTRYLVIIANNGANAITDVAGKAIEMPNQFRALAGDGVLLSAALAPVRDLVQNWTALAKAYLGAKQQDTEGLVMAYTLTTGGGIEVLSTMAAPGNANPLLQQNPVLRAVVAAAFANNPGDPSAGQDEAVTTLTASPYNVPAESVAAVIGLATSLQTPGPRTVSLPGPGLNIANFVPAFSGSSATVLTGTIDLPYYLEAPAGAYTGEDPVAAGYLCTPTDVNDAVCIARQTSAGNTIISQWSADDGLLPILGASPPSTNVTRLYPFAKKNGMREVPVLVVKPSTGEPTSAGYPVIIYQHGIFGNRTNSLAVANSMASQGFVTIAIDLPLHGVMPTDLISGTTTPIFASLLGAKGTDISGMDAATQALVIGGETVAERHFGLTNVASGFSPTGVSGTDASLNGSGSLFFNLVHLQTARDNSRQAVMDLLNLNASLSSFNIDGDSDFTDIDVSQVHYIGHSLGGIIGTVFVATNNLNGTTVNANGNAALPLITETVLGMPGSAIPRLLEASAAFGPSIKGPVTTPTAEGGFGLTENSESYNQLFYVFQGALDSADPASFAQAMSLIPSAVAKYMVIESIGDQVVPNSATSPLAGTTPLAGLLGTNQIYGNSNGAALETGKYFVRFNDADSSHGSLASPGAEDVELSAFTEIVTLTTKLFMGQNPEITDSTVVSAAE
ncbi:MAG: hypothetical protein ACI910_000007 [Oleispira sp.]|jgi:hypothetical protein